MVTSKQSGTKCYQSQVFSSPVIGRPNWLPFGTGGGKLNTYIMAVDANYGHDLQTIRANLDDEVPLVEQNIEKTRRSAFLFGLLASLLRGRPLLLLKGIEQGQWVGGSTPTVSHLSTNIEQQEFGFASLDHAVAEL